MSNKHTRLQVNMQEETIVEIEVPSKLTKEIKTRIKTFCKQQGREDLKIGCYAIATYDYCEFSNLSEWDLDYKETESEIEDGYKQEDRVHFIFRTAIKAKKEMPDEYHAAIYAYKNGFIPQCFDIYTELYC